MPSAYSDMTTLTIHPDLKSLIPALTAEERALLEANLLRDGCLAPLIVWQETQLLLDGHNRLALCQQHGLDYRCEAISLPDMATAKLWMIRNQRGRRNLTPEQASYLRGEEYNLEKQQGKRTDLTSDHTDTKSQNTAQRLAVQHHVSEPTIKRDGAYATAVDTLAEMVGPDVRQALLSREMKLTQKDVKLLATLLAASPETAQAVQQALQGPEPAAALRAILTAARCGICHRPLSALPSVSRGIGPICAGHTNGAARHAPSSAPPTGDTLERAAGMERFVQTLEQMHTEPDALSVAATPLPPIVPERQALEPPVAVPELAALFTQALRSLEALRAHLKTVALPATLDDHIEVCVALGKACRRVEHLMTEHPALLDALYGPPAPPAPADPPPPPLASPKVCRKGHDPYPASKAECPQCVTLRQRATRQRKAARTAAPQEA